MSGKQLPMIDGICAVILWGSPTCSVIHPCRSCELAPSSKARGTRLDNRGLLRVMYVNIMPAAHSRKGPTDRFSVKNNVMHLNQYRCAFAISPTSLPAARLMAVTRKCSRSTAKPISRPMLPLIGKGLFPPLVPTFSWRMIEVRTSLATSRSCH